MTTKEKLAAVLTDAEATEDTLIDALTDYWNDGDANPSIHAWFWLIQLEAA